METSAKLRGPASPSRLPAALMLHAVETCSFGVTLADAQQDDLPLIYANQAFSAMTGYSAADVDGRNCRFLQGPETDRTTLIRIRETLQSERPGTFLLLNYRKDGSRFWNRFQLSPIHDAGGRLAGYLGMQVDITDDIGRLGLENERQKMETLGRLAGGVAHELNNALQPIKLYAEMLNDRPAPRGESYARCVGGILENADFAGEVVSQILSFARGDEVADQIYGARDVIEEAVDFAAEYLPSSLSIERDGFGLNEACAKVAVRINRTALFQVMANLFKNAADACGSDGQICVSLSLASEAAPSRNGEAAVSSRPSGGPSFFVEVEVVDNGQGMDGETLRHIFEPFFTTKAPGQGVGLGLSTIYGIVERWGGRIHASSTPGKGTAFRLLIPVHPSE